MSISDLHHTDDADVTLIERVRSGDLDAFGVLHTRHVGSAQALARRMSRSPADADDLVSEGFARVLRALQQGKGPDLAFRPYLLSTIRRLAYDRTTREQREAPAPPDEHEVATPAGDPVLDGFERDTAAAAFASLPERWRTVLWHTEVEGQSPAEVARVLGMNPNAVAALAYRAREGLRQAYLAEHAPRTAATKECQVSTGRLGAYVRGGLTPAREARLRRHLDDCDDCQAAYLELASVNTAMPALVAFAVLGPAGGSYLASMGGGATGLSAAFSAAIAPVVQGGTAAAAGGLAAVGGAGGVASAGLGRLAGRGRQLAVAGAAAAVAVAVAVAARDGGGEPPVVVAADATTTTAGTDVHAAPVVDRAAPPSADPGAPVGTSTEPRAPAPSSPRSAPGRPTPTAPPATRPSPLRPTTTAPAPTPTTAPPATTAPSPTTTVPAAPSALTVELGSAGVLVRDRPGVITATVRNDGAGVGDSARVRIDLTGASLRGTPITPLGAGGRARAVGAIGIAGTRAPAADGHGWTCTTSGITALDCTLDRLAPGASSTLYVPVAVPGTGDPVKLRAEATADHDAGRPGSSPSITLPVDPAGMAARFATVDRGAVATAGNTLLTCDADDPTCATALAGGPGAPDNGSFPMVEVDVDDDPATTNSSAAALDLGTGAEVLSATLYWSGELGAGPGGIAAPDPARRDRAVLTGPDGAAVPIVAERVDDLTDDQRYQSVADVTAQVARAGAGRWTFAGAQLGTGQNTYGGWSIVVVQRHPSMPVRSLVVLDGFTPVYNSATVSFSVGGFVVPDDGTTSATLDVVTYEGDSSLVGDQLSVNGVALSDDANPVGNSFNSTATDRGVPRPGRDPGWPNLLGIDIDRFDVGGVLTPGSTSTTIEFSTAADQYLTGVVAFAVDQ